MDTAEIFVTVSGLSLIAFTLWFFFGKPEEEPVSTSGQVLYVCPMHPWITSNDPMAMYSICGMKLTARPDN